MDNKAFRRWLNERYPTNFSDPTKATLRHKNGAYEQRKREYGDYLWFQDRETFNRLKAEYEAGELV